MALELGPRRGKYQDITAGAKPGGGPLSPAELENFEAFDLVYRSLCALLYNYVPMSGHPGGSISSGRFVTGILFDSMDYDVSDPDRADADIISYAAGHKALGLYALWALRNEVLRLGAPELLPKDDAVPAPAGGPPRLPAQSRHEDAALHAVRLQGARRPPDAGDAVHPPLHRRLGRRRLHLPGARPGGHRLLRQAAPRVHIVEGEGGLTPGRVAEALAAAGTASLGNAIMHVDWNQASIDSNRVCRDGDEPGDYVQWNPVELFYLHDWNVI